MRLGRIAHPGGLAFVSIEDTPNGTVVKVVQSGYAIGDRVLRPALVGVAKGGARPAPAEGSGVERSV